MSTTRFLVENGFSSAVLLNATAVGAPARNEFASHPMENALTLDRRTPWYFDGGGTTVTYDLDAGASGASASGLFLHGLRALDGGVISVAEVLTSSTYYPAAVTWTSRWTLSTFRGIDSDFLVGPFSGAAVVARYWRVVLTLSASPLRYRLGSIRAGLPLNLGVIGSPGMSVTPRQNRLEQVMLDGSVNVNTLGPPGASVSIPLSAVNGALVVGKLDVLAAATGSVSYADESGYAKELVISGGTIQRTRRFIDCYDAHIEAEALP